MQITHEQAHQLIQRNMDQALHLQESAVLSAHLQECADCQSYAREMKEVEGLLLPLLRKQWRHPPIPLSIAALTEKKLTSQTGIFLAMRKAAIGLVVAAFFFSAWQFAFSGSSASSQLPMVAPSAPLLPVPSTSTAVTSENCEMLLYTVRQGDTLAGIAARFSAPEEEILARNNLAGRVHAGMQLIVPVCLPTPTGTVASEHLSRTYTPTIHLMTSTPAGEY